MKIRCGFVSNSSSSSQIILVPKGGIKLTITDELRQVMKDEAYEEFNEAETTKKLEACIKKLNSGTAVWDEEVGYGISAVLDKVVEGYVIASIDVSSEAGQIVPVLQKKVDEVLKHG